MAIVCWWADQSQGTDGRRLWLLRAVEGGKDIGDPDPMGRSRCHDHVVEGPGQLQETRVDQKSNAVVREGQNFAVGGSRTQRTQDRIEIV